MRRTILFFLLLISLLLTACSGEETTSSGGGAFIGGTQGVTAGFEAFGIEEDGVFTIFDEETFPLEVTLRNKGEYEIQPNDVTVKLLGPSPDEFSGIPSFELKNEEIIEKISELVELGGEETLTFSTGAHYEPEVTGFINREWFANIEYNYQTFVIIPEVCLKGNLRDERVCEVNEEKEYFVSGAPITVASVEESTAGKGIMALKIKVSNVGGGKVAKLTEEFGTTDRLAYSLNDPAWECKAAGKVNEARLNNDEAEIVCKLKEGLAEDILSTKQVQLTLNYKYRDLIQETLRIKESS